MLLDLWHYMNSFSAETLLFREVLRKKKLIIYFFIGRSMISQNDIHPKNNLLNNLLLE